MYVNVEGGCIWEGDCVCVFEGVGGGLCTCVCVWGCCVRVCVM